MGAPGMLIVIHRVFLAFSLIGCKVDSFMLDILIMQGKKT